MLKPFQRIPLPQPPLAAWVQQHRMMLAADTTHLWRFTLDHSAASQDLFAALCSPQERERATRFYTPTLTARFLARRALLRCALSLYTGDDPAQLRFTALAHGKPQLADRDVQFNLSHSGAVALLAVTRTVPIGVDLEAVQPIPDLALVAKHHFSSLEQHELFSLPSSEQPAAFYACWTRKEALIKADSRGLTIPLDAFDVTLLPDDPARFRRIDIDGLALTDWHLLDVPYGTGYRAAAAQPRPFAAIQHFEISNW